MQVLERFPAGAPRGSWPAEEHAARERDAGRQDAEVVMDLASDQFWVVTGRRTEDSVLMTRGKEH